MFIIDVSVGEGQIFRHFLLPNESYTVGRKDCRFSLPLDDPSISRHHATIITGALPQYAVTDSAATFTINVQDLSKHGTFVDREQIGRDNARFVYPEDRIRFGRRVSARVIPLTFVWALSPELSDPAADEVIALAAQVGAYVADERVPSPSEYYLKHVNCVGFLFVAPDQFDMNVSMMVALGYGYTLVTTAYLADLVKSMCEKDAIAVTDFPSPQPPAPASLALRSVHYRRPAQPFYSVAEFLSIGRPVSSRVFIDYTFIIVDTELRAAYGHVISLFGGAVIEMSAVAACSGTYPPHVQLLMKGGSSSGANNASALVLLSENDFQAVSDIILSDEKKAGREGILHADPQQNPNVSAYLNLYVRSLCLIPQDNVHLALYRDDPAELVRKSTSCFLQYFGSDESESALEGTTTSSVAAAVSPTIVSASSSSAALEDSRGHSKASNVSTNRDASSMSSTSASVPDATKVTAAAAGQTLATTAPPLSSSNSSAAPRSSAGDTRGASAAAAANGEDDSVTNKRRGNNSSNNVFAPVSTATAFNEVHKADQELPVSVPSETKTAVGRERRSVSGPRSASASKSPQVNGGLPVSSNSTSALHEVQGSSNNTNNNSNHIGGSSTVGDGDAASIGRSTASSAPGGSVSQPRETSSASASAQLPSGRPSKEAETDVKTETPQQQQQPLPRQKLNKLAPHGPQRCQPISSHHPFSPSSSSSSSSGSAGSSTSKVDEEVKKTDDVATALPVSTTTTTTTAMREPAPNAQLPVRTRGGAAGVVEKRTLQGRADASYVASHRRASLADADSDLYAREGLTCRSVPRRRRPSLGVAPSGTSSQPRAHSVDTSAARVAALQLSQSGKVRAKKQVPSLTPPLLGTQRRRDSDDGQSSFLPSTATTTCAAHEETSIPLQQQQQQQQRHATSSRLPPKSSQTQTPAEPLHADISNNNSHAASITSTSNSHSEQQRLASTTYRRIQSVPSSSSGTSTSALVATPVPSASLGSGKPSAESPASKAASQPEGGGCVRPPSPGRQGPSSSTSSVSGSQYCPIAHAASLLTPIVVHDPSQPRQRVDAVKISSNAQDSSYASTRVSMPRDNSSERQEAVSMARVSSTSNSMPMASGDISRTAPPPPQQQQPEKSQEGREKSKHSVFTRQPISTTTRGEQQKRGMAGSSISALYGSSTPGVTTAGYTRVESYESVGATHASGGAGGARGSASRRAIATSTSATPRTGNTSSVRRARAVAGGIPSTSQSVPRARLSTDAIEDESHSARRRRIGSNSLLNSSISMEQTAPGQIPGLRSNSVMPPGSIARNEGQMGDAKLGRRCEEFMNSFLDGYMDETEKRTRHIQRQSFMSSTDTQFLEDGIHRLGQFLQYVNNAEHEIAEPYSSEGTRRSCHQLRQKSTYILRKIKGTYEYVHAAPPQCLARTREALSSRGEKVRLRQRYNSVVGANGASNFRRNSIL